MLKRVSFREMLGHIGHEPTQAWHTLAKAAHSQLAHDLDLYLQQGGFPEAQGLDMRSRHALLRNYVDVVLLRDVIERHNLSQPQVLRWMVQQLFVIPDLDPGSIPAEKQSGSDLNDMTPITLDPMRLTPAQIATIKSTAHAVLGQGAQVTLFGSRVDDTAKGGDVDLMIEVRHDLADPAVVSARIASQVSRSMQGRKVDVLLKAPNLLEQPIHRIAAHQGVVL
jgi:hypothetical protein